MLGLERIPITPTAQAKTIATLVAGPKSLVLRAQLQLGEPHDGLGFSLNGVMFSQIN